MITENNRLTIRRTRPTSLSANRGIFVVGKPLEDAEWEVVHKKFSPAHDDAMRGCGTDDVAEDRFDPIRGTPYRDPRKTTKPEEKRAELW